MHGLHQGSHMFRRGQLMDAVTQVENVRGATGGGVGVWLAKAVQYPNDLFFNGLRWGK